MSLFENCWVYFQRILYWIYVPIPTTCFTLFVQHQNVTFRTEALTNTMLCVPFIKCSCTKYETLLVSFLYITFPKLKPKTHPHAAECFFRIRVTQMVKKCTSFHTNRVFIIFFTQVRHRTTLRLIEPQLTIRIWFCLRTGLFPSDFQC